jgi:hypothetical protein
MPNEMKRPITWAWLIAGGWAVAATPLGAQTNALPVRVALVAAWAGETNANVAALATAGLSREPGVTLIERDQVERVLREHQLARSGLLGARQALAVGKLLGVDVFAVLENFPGEPGALGVVVFDAATGVKLSDSTVDGDTVTANADRLKAAVLAACAKRQRGPSALRTVCLASVRNAALPREMNSACDAAGRFLEQRLLNSPDLTVLERRRLDQINTERTLPGNEPVAGLLASLTMLELEIGKTADGQSLQATVFLTGSSGAETGRVRTNVSTRIPVTATEALIPSLLSTLRASRPIATANQHAEARRFHAESWFLLTDGDAPGALRAAEAAVALDAENQTNQIQLAACLTARAMEILSPKPAQMGPRGKLVNFDRFQLRELMEQGHFNVDDSLPLAERALELCRTVRMRAAARGETLPARFFEAETRLTDANPRFQRRGYWERALPLTEAVTPEMRNRLLAFQADLRHLRTRMHAEYWRSQATNDTAAEAFAAEMDLTLENAEKFVASSAEWVADVERLMSVWLDFFERHPMGWGGWRQFFNRPLARLCVQANGCDEQGFNRKNLPLIGDVPRVNNWQLQPPDLVRLGDLFGRMARHPDLVVQCYGRIGQLALTLREERNLTPAVLDQYAETREFIRSKLSSPGRKPQNLYRRLVWAAARDLVDLMPDAAFRRREHLELFELSLARRQVVFWTAWMACSPEARRFNHYYYLREPFPVDPVGYESEDAPLLLANARCVRNLYASRNRMDVDGRAFSFRRGSFEREMDAIIEQIHKWRPDLKTNTVTSTPWTSFQTLFVAGSESGPVRNVCVHGAEAFALMLDQFRFQGSNQIVRIVRIPLNGGAVQTLTAARLPQISFEMWLATPPMCVDGETLYYAVGDKGVFHVNLRDNTTGQINESSGLLSDKVRAFAVAGNKLFAMLVEGHLVAYDRQSKRCEILATRRSRETLSPLDGPAIGFEVTAMISDVPRRRVLFTTRLNGAGNCHPLVGLWQIDCATDRMSQLLQLYRPATWLNPNGPDELVLFCPSDLTSPACKPASYAVLTFDLVKNTPHLLWTSDGRPVGPAVNADVRTTRKGITPREPMLPMDDWLWMTWESAGRLSLQNRRFEDFAPPELPRSNGRPTWHTLRRVNDHQLLAADDTRVWLVTLPEDSVKVKSP